MGAIAIAVMLKAPFGIWGWVIQRYDVQLFPVGRRLVLTPAETPQNPSHRSSPCRPPATQSATKARDRGSRPRLAPTLRRARRRGGRGAAHSAEVGEGHARCRLRPHPAAERASAAMASASTPGSRSRASLARPTRRTAGAPSLIIHHAHLIAQYPKPRRRRCGPTASMCRSRPRSRRATQAVPVDGGYRVSGKGSPFASGVDHCTWVMLGGMAQDGDEPEWKFFLVAPGDYTVRDTWFTAGMRGTGSKTIVTDNAFVPSGQVLTLDGFARRQNAGRRHAQRRHLPHAVFLLCADLVRDADARRGAGRLRACSATGPRRARRKTAHRWPRKPRCRCAWRAPPPISMPPICCCGAPCNVTDAPQDYSPKHLARSVRDFARASELTVAAIDTLVALSGTASFNTSHPIQRAWRDIHFMSMHISRQPGDEFFAFRPHGTRPRPRCEHRPYF